MAGLNGGRVPLRAALAFPHHVGHAPVRLWPPDYGRATWLEQLRFHADWMEKDPEYLAK